MTGIYSAPLVAVFIAAISHIVLGFIADFILDAMDTVFLCYAIGKCDTSITKFATARSITLALTQTLTLL